MSKRKVWPIFLFCHRRCTQYNPYIYTLTQWLCLSDESTDALSWILMFASFLFFVRVSSQAVEFLGTVIFKNCYYICSLTLSMLLTIHPWILRDNELWFCAFNSLSVTWCIIKAHSNDSYIQFTHRLFYGGFWFSNHKYLLF